MRGLEKFHDGEYGRFSLKSIQTVYEKLALHSNVIVENLIKIRYRIHRYWKGFDSVYTREVIQVSNMQEHDKPFLKP